MNHPPYGPEDLKDPPLSGDAFIRELHRQKSEKYPDPPPLYQDLIAGKLKRGDLELWAKNMYEYWDQCMVFSTGAIFVKTNEEGTRTHILRRMVDIEGEEVVNDLTGWTTPAYEELWLRFAEGLGLRREDVLNWKTFTRTHFAISTLNLLSRWWEWSWLDGIASFYAGDLLVKENMGRIEEALRTHYGLRDESLEFFRVCLGDAESHLPWEEETLAYWACTTERQLTAARALRNRLDIEYQALLPVYTAATTGQMPLQVP
jgi:pyrroloquinoline-quinone synthase